MTMVSSAAHRAGPASGESGKSSGLGADDRVDADLGQQAGEDGRDRRRRRRVAVGQPRRHREDGRLDGEGGEQAELQHERDAGVEVTEADGELREVDRARGGIHRGDADEEERAS